MRACMVAYTFYEPDNRVRRYAETLVKRGDSVDAIVLRQKGQSPFDVIGGVHVHRIQQRVINEGNPLTYLIKLLLFLLRSAWMLAWRHLRAPYDLIHVHSVPDFQVFATLIPRLMGAKVILDIHDIVPELYASKFRISQESLLFRFARRGGEDLRRLRSPRDHRERHLARAAGRPLHKPGALHHDSELSRPVDIPPPAAYQGRERRVRDVLSRGP